MSRVSPPSASARAGDVVPAAAHRDRQAVVARVADRLGHVAGACRLHDERGRARDQAVPQSRGVREAVLGGAQQRPLQAARAAAPRGARARTRRAARPADRRRSPRSRAAASRGAAASPSAAASGVARSWRPQMSAVGTAIRASASSARPGSAKRSIRRPSAACAAGVRARTMLPVANASQSPSSSSRSRSRSRAQRRHSALVRLLAGLGHERVQRRAERRRPARTGRGRARRRARAARAGRPRVAANRAAIPPPSAYPTSAGGDAQVASISSSSHANRRSSSSSSASTGAAPWPGRSGATTRQPDVSAGSTRPQCDAFAARAVQEHERRTVAPHQQRGRDAGERVAALLHPGRRRAAGRSSVPPRGSRLALCPRRAATASARPPNLRRGARWVIPPSQTSRCSYA